MVGQGLLWARSLLHLQGTREMSSRGAHDISTLRHTVTAMEDAYRYVASSVRDAHAVLVGFRAEIDDIRFQARAQTQMSDGAANAINALQEAVDSLRENASARLARIEAAVPSQLNAQRSQIQSQYEQLQARHEQLQAQYGQLQAQVHQLQASLQEEQTNGQQLDRRVGR